MMARQKPVIKTNGPPAAWLLITSSSSWSRLASRGEWAFAEKYSKRAMEIQPGDDGVVYLTIDRENSASALGGLVRFTGTVGRVEEEKTLFDRLYPLRVPIEVVQRLDEPAAFAPYIEKLSFITQKSWGIHLQGQPAKVLTQGDFAILKRAIIEGN